jgi:hypothetical protein
MKASAFVPVLLASSLLAVQDPTLESVLARAGESVLAFHQQFRMIVAEESYTQSQRFYTISSQAFKGENPAGPMASGYKLRKLRADVALVASPHGDVWFAFRDVFEVDGKPLRDRKNRVERALEDSPATARAELDRMSAESKRYNLGSIARNVNVPTLALMTLMPANQKGMAFQKKGEKKVDGVRAWVVAFTETQRPTIVTTAENKPMPARGELSVDPATGQILKTRIVWDSLDAFGDMKEHPERYSSFPRIEIEVIYRHEPKLDMWVPVEMKELYDRQVEVVTCTATYSNFRRFETDVKLLVPKG